MEKMELEKLREEIDMVDDGIISLLSKREGLIKEIALIKKRNGIPVLDREREAQILQTLKKKAEERGLDGEFVLALYRLILKNSKKNQEND